MSAPPFPLMQAKPLDYQGELPAVDPLAHLTLKEKKKMGLVADTGKVGKGGKQAKRGGPPPRRGGGPPPPSRAAPPPSRGAPPPSVRVGAPPPRSGGSSNAPIVSHGDRRWAMDQLDMMIANPEAVVRAWKPIPSPQANAMEQLNWPEVKVVKQGGGCVATRVPFEHMRQVEKLIEKREPVVRFAIMKSTEYWDALENLERKLKVRFERVGEEIQVSSQVYKFRYDAPRDDGRARSATGNRDRSPARRRSISPPRERTRDPSRDRQRRRSSSPARQRRRTSQSPPRADPKVAQPALPPVAPMPSAAEAKGEYLGAIGDQGAVPPGWVAYFAPDLDAHVFVDFIHRHAYRATGEGVVSAGEFVKKGLGSRLA